MSAENNNFSNGLWLIGLGPGNPDLLTTGGVEAIENCKHVFIEGYTANLQNVDVEELQERFGEWKTLMRTEIEKPNDLLALASKESVALLIIGDALQATTHIDLILRCQKQGIPINLIPGISITTLIGEVGLQAYRFGRQTTIPYIYKSYLPTSPLEVILMNRKNNLHTLVLLDLDPTGMGEDKPQPMTPFIAIDTLNSMSEKLKNNGEEMDGNIMSWDAVLCSNLGTRNNQIRYSSLENLSKIELDGMHCLIIPSSLHEIESLALSRWEAE
ncbi:MAG: diphthine synthase [Euryarchaeota archaeon]|nr:diphthine synthase [Euryarchaeota archaeon]|tara:strand:- start:359 stop:1174 length:816 start_codon:yes stop_codon:yes gene_type:complete